ncbi:MAG: coenzyme F420 hydrogenase/dehydrogenase beta subunit N-terminal domain-containing protein [Desulfoprunum sp.]
MIKETSRDTLDKTGYFQKVWAACHFDPEIRGQSSSGGVFSALTENALNKGGAVLVVVGTAFT